MNLRGLRHVSAWSEVSEVPGVSDISDVSCGSDITGGSDDGLRKRSHVSWII